MKTKAEYMDYPVAIERKCRCEFMPYITEVSYMDKPEGGKTRTVTEVICKKCLEIVEL